MHDNADSVKLADTMCPMITWILVSLFLIPFVALLVGGIVNNDHGMDQYHEDDDFKS